MTSDEKPAATSVGPASGLPGERPTVLVADDDPAFRLLLRAALERAGFRIEEAGSGSSAMQVFEAVKPDLVLLDIMMPERDGYATCRALRESPGGRNTPVVMLTSLGDTESITRAYEVGATDFLTKPVNYLLLSHRLRYILRANRYLAHYDELTGLPNRTRFLGQLEHILSTAARHEEPVAVLFVGLDRFQRFNENLGHMAGDELLRQVAKRLCGSVRAEDFVARESPRAGVAVPELPSEGTIARLGGDEFVIVLRQVGRLEDSATVARRVLECLHRPFTVGEHELHATASIGISAFPLDGDDPLTLMHHAELAMHYAKRDGRDRLRFHTSSLNAQTARRYELETNLRGALAGNEFELHYQPKLSIDASRVTGVEALLRWCSPDLGPVAPAEFVPVAESTGLILPIGNWVLRTALAQLRAWHDADHPGLGMAINISPLQFDGRPLVREIAALLEETGVDPRAVELEVTEGLLMDHTHATLATLNGLKQLGVRIAVDDFGTGYSSLSYLKRLPLDTLKIDRCFVRDLETDHQDLLISRAIVELAHSLGLEVVAEGVESELQLEALRAAGCDGVQGFLFSRALPGADCARWLDERRARQEEAAGPLATRHDPPRRAGCDQRLAPALVASVPGAREPS